MKQVDVPTMTGAFGILPAHVPTLQVLRPGVVTVFSEDGSAAKYFGEIKQVSLMTDFISNKYQSRALLQILNAVVLGHNSFPSQTSVTFHYRERRQLRPLHSKNKPIGNYVKIDHFVFVSTVCL